MRHSMRLLLLLLVLAFGAVPAEPAPRRGVRILVPAYFYPAGEGLRHWDRLIAAAARVPVVAIVNPASGPGTKADPNYERTIERARKAGVTLIGYVSTSYAKRPRAEVEADMEGWLKLYPDRIQGFFLDEQTSDAGKVEYYRSLCRFARERVKRALLVTNPGTVCAPEYLAPGGPDVVCLFENKEGFDGYTRPQWAAAYDPDRFLVLPYAIPDAARMQVTLRKAVRDGFGYLYITDASGANPWDRLPSYWDAEVAEVRDIRENTQ